MKIIAFELRIDTLEGVFGSKCTFKEGLNIIRGNNSSGKSTLINCLLYGLGLEELIGGKNLSSLTSAVTDKFKYEGRDISVLRSETLVEIENRAGSTVTIRRPIKSDEKDPKLVEVIEGLKISRPSGQFKSSDKYLHDKGSAFLQEGYYSFLTSFLNLKLPRIINNKGGEVPLYVQTIFSAMVVEQKRGWSDYLANCPYYDIKDNKTKVIEFLLDLDVFKNDFELAKLNSRSLAIQEEWRNSYVNLESRCKAFGVYFDGISASPKATFSADSASLWKIGEPKNLQLCQYIGNLRAGLLDVETDRGNAPEKNEQLAEHLTNLQKLSLRYESVVGALVIQRNSLSDIIRIESEKNDELIRNKTIHKLHRLGSEHELATAKDKCPTCLQSLNESLLASEVFGLQMDLEQNIIYQEKQLSMLRRQIGATKAEVARLELTEKEISSQITATKDIISKFRTDLRSNETESRAAIRQQMILQDLLQSATELSALFQQSLISFTELARQQKENAEQRAELPKENYSEKDIEKIRIFEKNFRANASSFDYQSVEPHKIKIGLGNLLPLLEDIELRAIFSKLRADSSASDFIRLIWSYVLALYQTSSMTAVSGNHPGFLMLDEPAQHSMGETALRALFQQLAGSKGLQSIVAASFEESDHAFNQATSNVDFHLIRINSNARSIAQGLVSLDV